MLHRQLLKPLHSLHEAPEFAGHDVQLSDCNVLVYLPGPQDVQSCAPLVFLYFPTLHAVQVPPAGPVYPGLQVQLLSEVHALHEAPEFCGHATQLPDAKVLVYVPASHGTQVPGPVVLLYLPAAHAVQTPPLGPV